MVQPLIFKQVCLCCCCKLSGWCDVIQHDIGLYLSMSCDIYNNFSMSCGSPAVKTTQWMALQAKPSFIQDDANEKVHRADKGREKQKKEG